MAVTALKPIDSIDIWEAVRRAVLERNPSLSSSFDRDKHAPWSEMPGRERATLALVAALDLTPLTPAVRRHARTFLQCLHEESRPGSIDSAGLVAEEAAPLPEFESLSHARRHKLAADADWIAGAGFAKALSTAGGPVPAMTLIEKKCRTLRGRRAARFLHLLGYPIAIPDRAKLRWLHRFGLLESEAETNANRHAALRIFEGIVRDAGVEFPELEAVFSAFTGTGEAQEAGLCLPRPRCVSCPLNTRCAYGRFAKQQGNALEETRRNLSTSFLPEDRPREKLKARGSEHLTDSELLAILLRTGSGQEHAVELAARLLRTAGSIKRLAHFSIDELSRIRGIGEVKAITIKAALELARRLDTAPKSLGKKVGHARDIFERLRSYFLERRKEQFLCLLLDTKHKILRQVTISEGTLSQALVHPREAFQDAVKDSAAAVIFVHNHPSGDPTPSGQDKAITARLVRAGEVMGIRVLDHVIIGRDTFYSFSDEGKLNG